jgi:hypothetical protein
MRFCSILLLLFITLHPAWSQRKGAVEAGGSFYFRSISDATQKNNSMVNLALPIGYYVTKNLIIDINPSFQLNFHDDSTQVSLFFLIGVSQKIFNISQDYNERYTFQNPRRMDYAANSAVYAAVAAGVWSEGLSFSQQPGHNYTGPAIMGGLTVSSAIGHGALLKTRFQWIYCLPTIKPYDTAHSIIQLGVGISAFVVM